MAKPRFYMDEHISKAVVAALRTNGVDVLTVPEAGTLGASDEEHLQRATGDGRVIVTQDRDFLRLAATGIHHAGIAYDSQNRTIGELVRGLMLIHQVLNADEMKDHVEHLQLA